MTTSLESFERCCRLCAEEQEVTIMIFSEEAEAMLLQNKLNKYLLIEVHSCFFLLHIVFSTKTHRCNFKTVAT